MMIIVINNGVARFRIDEKSLTLFKWSSLIRIKIKSKLLVALKNLISFLLYTSFNSVDDGDDGDGGDDYDDHDGDYDDDVRDRELTHTVCVLLSPFSSLLLADDVVPSKTVHRNVMLCTSM